MVDAAFGDIPGGGGIPGGPSGAVGQRRAIHEVVGSSPVGKQEWKLGWNRMDNPNNSHLRIVAD